MIKYEAEMYAPVKKYLEELGYTVNAEVKNCDITAKKDDSIIILEMKKSFNISLVYQLMERKELFNQVYAVIPRPKNCRSKNVRYMIKLAGELGVGIITVAVESGLKGVGVLCEPKENVGSDTKARKRKRNAILNEIDRRKSGDKNIGGVTGKKLITAYKEAAIALLCYGENMDYIAIRDVPQSYKGVLQTNYYKWFERSERGKYIISDKGREAFNNAEFADVIEYYRKEENMICSN